MKKIIIFAMVTLLILTTTINAENIKHSDLILIAEQMVSDAETKEEYELANILLMFVSNPEYVISDINPTGKFNYGKSIYIIYDKDKLLWKRKN